MVVDEAVEGARGPAGERLHGAGHVGAVAGQAHEDPAGRRGTGGQGLGRLWFPFTQHGRLEVGDVRVVDSRAGDTWSPPRPRPPCAAAHYGFVAAVGFVRPLMYGG